MESTSFLPYHSGSYMSAKHACTFLEDSCMAENKQILNLTQHRWIMCVFVHPGLCVSTCITWYMQVWIWYRLVQVYHLSLPPGMPSGPFAVCCLQSGGETQKHGAQNTQKNSVRRQFHCLLSQDSLSKYIQSWWSKWKILFWNKLFLCRLEMSLLCNTLPSLDILTYCLLKFITPSSKATSLVSSALPSFWRTCQTHNT